MSFSDIFNEEIINGFVSDISTAQILSVLSIALILGLYIFMIYRLKTKSTFYAQDFNIVLAALPIVTSGIVLAMQSSVVISLGMVGALSIVRFRNAVKNSLDLLFLFWSISVGIVCGAGIFDIAIYVSATVTMIIFVLDLIPLAKKPMLLVINAKSPEDEVFISNLLKDLTSNYKIKSRSVSTSGLDLVVELRTKQEKRIIDECYKNKNIINANLLSYDGERKF